MRLQIEQNWRTVRVFDVNNPCKWASGTNTYSALGHFIQGHLDFFKVGYREFHAQRQEDGVTTDFEWWVRWLIENADRLGVTILK